MSRGPGAVQRFALDELQAHRVIDPGAWTTAVWLADARAAGKATASELASVRRALHALADAGLIETTTEPEVPHGPERLAARMPLTPRENATWLEVQRLVMAEADMRMAAAAARLLQQTEEVYRSRALETAIVVCYMRPFTKSNTVGALGRKWHPKDDAGRRLHRSLYSARNSTHAHTDLISYRKAVNTAALLGDYTASARRYAEEWRPLDRAVLPALVPFFEARADAFRAGKDAAERRLAELIS
jgi:hypothetical protein